MCEWWKKTSTSICFHPTHGSVSDKLQSDMQLHWQSNSKKDYRDSLLANHVHKSNHAATLEVTGDLRSPIHTWRAGIMEGCMTLSVSLGFTVLFWKMRQCACDKSTAITPSCTICRCAVRLSCGALHTSFALPTTPYVSCWCASKHFFYFTPLPQLLYPTVSRKWKRHNKGQVC